MANHLKNEEAKGGHHVKENKSTFSHLTNDIETGPKNDGTINGAIDSVENRDKTACTDNLISYGKASNALSDERKISNMTNKCSVVLIAKIFAFMAILATIFAIAMTNIQTSNNHLRSNASNGSTTIPYTDVVVIGAGWAGLKAAQTLVASGKIVLVLEAKDYVGGRARSDNSFVEGSPTELGCEWLYTGETDMSAYLMEEMGYDFFPRYELHGLNESSIFLSTTTRDEISGQVVKITKVLNDTEKMAYNDNIIDAYTSYLRSSAQFFYNNSGNIGVKQDESFADALEEFAWQQSGHLSKENKEVLYLYESELEIEFAGDDKNLSVKELGNDAGGYYEGGMRYTSVTGAGFGNIAHEFAKPFLSSIQLNAVVKEINHEHDSVVTVSYDDANGVSRIAYAQTALVTVSLGVLKAGNIKFTPSLSKEKQDVIDAMGFGGLNKCIMVWDDPRDMVWPKDDLWFSLAAPGEQSYGKWTSFFNPSRYKSAPMLIGWTSGEDAVAIESQSDEEIMNDVMKSLKIMFPTISIPTNYIITRWNSDKHFKGAYAYSHVGRNMTADATNLGQNMNRLWFAGEATDTEGWHGTTIGAWNTGKYAALDILAFLELE
eukprot:CAMPEP_0176497800 /NCGR_PEP_ID=MMETSP0200_2-20121128/11941_1 /TAXON_ID=947934 /ORGANISM="Chaetoceros sp., Strain GSL56" /LENGTH=603 /DNA_ID=CAMNT_0017895885 /DNA_START=290 /DNA_END=2101 /DNA_ORIENTATION=+